MKKSNNDFLKYYKSLIFKKPKSRPFFCTSFVATIDGKVQVKKDGYWPIGSKVDYDVFTILRSHADVIIDGKNTALQFGKATIDTLHSQKFQSLRKEFHKQKQIEYIIVTMRPDQDLKNALTNAYNYQPMIFTKSVSELLKYLKQKNYQTIFVDGGPSLLGSFFREKLIDEVFLTISPKIFGNDGSAITMVEGILFSPTKIPQLKLLSSSTVQNEIFLHYKVQK